MVKVDEGNNNINTGDKMQRDYVNKKMLAKNKKSNKY